MVGVLAHASRRGAARAARRARGVRRRAQDDGHPAAVPVGEPPLERRFTLLGREVDIDPERTPLRLDGGGLPMHGLLSAAPGWRVEHHDEATLEAVFDFAAHPELHGGLPVRPHAAHRRHARRARRCASRPRSTASATGVPIAFGFHPYLDAARRRARGLAGRDPGHRAARARRPDAADRRTAPLSRSPPGRSATRTFDDAYLAPAAPFALEGGGRRIELAFEAGYPYAQVFAPPGDALIAFEPMTAPTNALVTGDFTPLAPGDSYRAVFAITVR